MNSLYSHSGSLLLINPWIYDFAAYDLWLKPLGMLYLAGYLRQQGYQIHLIDCLDRANPALLKFQGLRTPVVKPCGTGRFLKRKVPRPAVLQQVPYPYCRYGIPENIFLDMLQATPRPDAVLVTSMMTYWYPGVFRAIELVKQHFQDVPVVLGGVYAALCTNHARIYSGADCVLPERSPSRILRMLEEVTQKRSSGAPCEEGVEELFQVQPAYDLYDHLDYAVILTSLGCPYRCTYCASHTLCSRFSQRAPDAVFQDIVSLYETRQIRDFAFYDDALLVNFQTHLKPILQQVIAHRLSCRFHTPNGIHAKYIDSECAQLLFQAGFTTLRLSLETIDPTRQQETGGKVTNKEFERAVKILQQTGFRGKHLGAYLFVGLPGQNIEEVEATIRSVHALGVQVSLCEYSPIPGTQDWAFLEQHGLVQAHDDPVLHNNSVYLSTRGLYPFDVIQRLKNMVRQGNRRIPVS